MDTLKVALIAAGWVARILTVEMYQYLRKKARRASNALYRHRKGI